ncbi:MAG: WYL domain-containing protein [Parasporobacterium sp.]|nr:WYL domain-containing protein [Parasporobacterium sp.]
MARGNNQKLKLFYLAKILYEETDETHGLTMPQIIEKLEEYDVSAERKSIYSDFEALEEGFGIEIICTHEGRQHYYHAVSRMFELPELKLLVDAIQSSKFITLKKSKELISKLESLASKYEAKELQRQVFVQNRIKTMNESIYYSVDAINSAISANHKVSFRYFNWNIKKEMEFRHDGAVYAISPWALTWDDENYYMIGYDSDADKIKHYRVDKMMNISETEEKREGRKLFKSFDLASYAKKSFGMFSGEEELVKLLVDNEMAGVIIDRFGFDVTFLPKDKKSSYVMVNVAVSDAFFGWIFGLGGGVRIAGPASVSKKAKALARKFV